MLGLPDRVLACLFDLDGVLTDTAAVHSAAWERTFNAFLDGVPSLTGELEPPFSKQDYRSFVDGKPRADGVRDFLAGRRIALPEGEPDDPPDLRTVHGLANLKNQMLLQRMAEAGVEVFQGSVRYLHAARDLGLRRAVVSSSANTRDVLEVSGLTSLIEERVDGVTLQERRLRGKPAPDAFLEGARRLGVAPSRAAVFEDAIAGVEAAKAGGFAFVVGVDRGNQGAALRAHGADLVVTDLAELLCDKETR